MIEFDIGEEFESLIQWLTANFSPFFDAITQFITLLINGLEAALLYPPSYVMVALLTALAWWTCSRGMAAFSFIGLLLIDQVTLPLPFWDTTLVFGMGFWELLMQTVALTLIATLLCLIVGIPVGIWASKNNAVNQSVRPVLDFMQTMPAFVYLIPAVLLFGLGKVPGVIATFIFATPPVVRLTNLGIREVPEEVVEASRSFGATTRQTLFKVELPVALPTIMAGVNQTIMLALSMVVIAALIGAEGLGGPVVRGVTQLQIADGFNGGLAIVILAIYLDRITQSIGEQAATASGSAESS
ncbi:MAG: proline/glycine betaine ABC transporter permease [Longimonas sp.]|uniref:ABC transporter permease n=1 Tax=Longimonas sp. TaxID=2039626 RepID=UPI00397713FB